MGSLERRRRRPVEKDGLLRSGTSANNCECQLANVLLQQFHSVPVAPACRHLHHLPGFEFTVVLSDRAHAVLSNFEPCNQSAKQRVRHGDVAADVTAASLPVRSEEHTSELQSLMRISYADFCLRKKKKTN